MASWPPKRAVPTLKAKHLSASEPLSYSSFCLWENPNQGEAKNTLAQECWQRKCWQCRWIWLDPRWCPAGQQKWPSWACPLVQVALGTCWNGTLAGWLSRWMDGSENPAHCETHNFWLFFHYFGWGRGTSLDKTESINEVKSLSSLCNVQKLEQVKPKMMLLVFFYNVVLLAFLLL